MQQTLPQHEIVLLGVGHTNAHIVRMWRMNPIPNARLTCVSNHWTATYSGMLPGVLAGQYPAERMEIDLVRLCASAGARLIVGEVTGLNEEGSALCFTDRPPLPFDQLSIGVGSVPDTSAIETDSEAIVPIKPMQTFLDRFERRIAQCTARKKRAPLRVAVVGGGIGGVEITFCVQQRLRQKLKGRDAEVTIICSSPNLGNGVLPKTSEAIAKELKEANIRQIVGRVESAGDVVKLDNDEELEFDIVLWATSARPPGLLEKLKLPTADDGFLAVHQNLRTTADLPIYAVGDSATLIDSPTSKSGVFAVRQGPILWENLQRTLAEQPLQIYEPQRDFLKLVNLGDGRAIAEYKGMTFTSSWYWQLKDQIDGRFMDKYQDYKPMKMAPPKLSKEQEVRCLGCGGKVGGSTLSRALQRLEVTPHPHVLMGLAEPDDAALIQPPSEKPLSWTVDFFSAPFDDPFLVGRMAALNAISDLYANGAKPLAALTIATLPLGPTHQQEQLLYELLAGGLHEFQPIDVSLAGGHTIEGPNTTIGYTMLAEQNRQLTAKANLRAGDLLVLTKPLGTGVLLAAHMQARCRGPWMDKLLESVLTSNRAAAYAALDQEITCMTDVTGFGLAGHLLEMLKASQMGASLKLSALPLLAGTEELLIDGMESTLAPANRDAEISIDVDERLRTRARYSALFDPQTCGGLLIAVAADKSQELLKRLNDDLPQPAVVIGEVTSNQEADARLRIDP